MAELRRASPQEDLLALVEALVSRVAALQAEVAELASGRSSSPAESGDELAVGRRLPTDDEPVDLAVLAEWVTALQVRYATATDWLTPCWWRHGYVIEELAALREAWLGVYDASEPTDRAAGLRWHDEAQRCRERIRKTISLGSGCSVVAHVEDDLVTDDPRWIEELAALTGQVSLT